jgi:sugar phosphate isomerase/epimerase
MTPPALNRRDLLKGSAVAGAAAMTKAFRAGAAAKAPDDRWQIGIYTRPWDKYDWRTALDAIAEAGYRYAGLMTTKSKTRLVISVETTPEEAEQVGRACGERGLKVPSVYGGGIPVAESLEAGIRGMRRLIDNCAICGAANLLMGGIGNKDLYDRYYKAVAETCAYAAERGVGISVKPHGGLNATGPQCRKTVETVGHPNFRIWYDPGNIYYYSNSELDPVDDAPTVAGLVVGMCVKDYVHPKKVAVTPGDGQVDFPKVMRRLKAGGFTAGALVVECLAPGDAKHLLAEAKKARRFVEALVA